MNAHTISLFYQCLDKIISNDNDVTPDVENKLKEKEIDKMEVVTNRITIFFESSWNSLRLSVNFKVFDDFELMYKTKWLKFIHNRAEELQIIRKIPINNYDLSFLIYPKLIKLLSLPLLKNLIPDIIQDCILEIAETALFPHQRGRIIATQFLSQFNDEEIK